MQNENLVIGVDFDGTIVTENFPGIGEIKQRTVDLMHTAIKAGHTVIIWTCRTGQHADEARNFLIDNNIPFHYFNDNPEDPWRKAGSTGKKIFCNYYLDDRAIHVDDIDKLFKKISEEELYYEG